MMRTTKSMLKNMQINKDRMRQNLDETDGMIMAQRVMLFLSEHIDRTLAEEQVRAAAHKSIDTNMGFRDALLADPMLAPHLRTTLDDLLNPETYLGLAREQVDLTIANIKEIR